MAESEYITRSEHNEFAKRVDDAQKRTDERVGELERVIKTFAELPFIVKQIKQNQDEQKTILEEIRNKPEQRINTARQTIVNAFLTTISNAISLGFMALIAWAIYYAIVK